MKTEILRMLSPNAIDLLNTGGGFARLTPQDVAGALSGLPDGPYYLGMCVYVADSFSFPHLYREVASMRGVPAKPEALNQVKCSDCNGTGMENHQDEDEEGFEPIRCPECDGHGYRDLQPVESVLMLCLDELWGNNKCKDCDGAGVTHNQYDCPTCRGRKFKVYTDMSRARQAKIPHEYWARYRGFYKRLHMALTDWDAQIRTHIARQLFEVDEA